MDDWTKEQRDWMWHCVRLNDERAKDPVKLNRQEVDRLKWEAKVQRKALVCIEGGHPLDGPLIPVARYLRTYADLHIEWYAGRMEAAAMREALLEAKGRMWVSLGREATPSTPQGLPLVTG